MLYDLDTMSHIYDVLTEKAPNVPVVYDPIWRSSSGQELFKINDESLEFLKTKFIPNSFIITPNIPETEKICKINISNLDDMVIGAQMLKDMGANIVLLKGGHANGDIVHDVLLNDKLLKIYESEKINTKNTHGSGCSLASAIAANLSYKMPVEKSISKAREYVHNAIKNSIKPGKGDGTLNHSFTKSEIKAG